MYVLLHSSKTMNELHATIIE